MDKASEFDFYSIDKLLNGPTAKNLIEVLGSLLSNRVPAGQEIACAQFWLAEVIPSSFDVLNDIGEKAKQYRDKPLIAKKPNSKNAKIHYFVRLLSDYCQRTYSQPLNEVVAITTSVIFVLPNCDVDYVRKIVKT